MNETLHLPLKAKWYDMIESGEKPEEYRKKSKHWLKRICSHFQTKHGHECRGIDCRDCFDASLGHALAIQYVCHQYKYAEFSYGYTKRRMTWEIDGITIGYGNPEWGAPKDEEVFIIKLKRRII